MMRRAGMALAIAALVALAAPGEALACACCTNPGQRYVDVETLDPGRLEEIESLRFGKEARLFVGEAGVEAIKGIQNPAERYELRVDWNKTHAAVGKTDLNFTLTNPGGRSGTLSLRLPQTISIFEVDPRDSPDQGTGPVLYKEWKLIGEVTGTGAFSGTNSPKQVLTLVLQGRGNSCTSAADFTHWTLVTEGPKGVYSLFGRLVE
jgi:hypothetical protein